MKLAFSIEKIVKSAKKHFLRVGKGPSLNNQPVGIIHDRVLVHTFLESAQKTSTFGPMNFISESWFRFYLHLLEVVKEKRWVFERSLDVKKKAASKT